MIGSEENEESKAMTLFAEESSNCRPKEKTITVIAFYVFGFLIYAIYSLIISGAQDILAGTYVPTSAVLIANVGPYFIITVVTPYFIQKIPYFPRVLAIFFLEASGLTLVIATKHVETKLLGVSLSSFGFGLGELSFIAMTSFYHETAVIAFSAGTGTGISLSPLYYTAMTTWACVSPAVAMSIMASSLVLLLIFYSLMERKHSQGINPRTTGITRKDIQYSPIDEDRPIAELKDADHLTWKEKLSAMKTVCPIIFSIISAWIAEYLIIQSVITTIAFPSAPFPPRDHYQYYIFIFLFGELFGRSYLIVLSYLMPSLAPKLVIHKIWFLAAAEMSILVFFLFAAWYRFLTDITIVLVFAFIGGLIIGVMYVNMLAIYSEIEEPKSREFVLGYASAATGAGAITAGLLGLLFEPWLRHHCLTVETNGSFCFTRSQAGRGCK
ncbi:uncharacterized protein [Montipora capricornis]|uniref:uncharacterized protein n=1 Tax=Montipora capricornis TaxID=246305 RepID=UPI0035F17035